MYYTTIGVDIHRSARRHGIDDDDIRHAYDRHAYDHPLVVSDPDPEADPPRVFVLGPDRAGNLIEVVILVLAEDRLLAIHAMSLRRTYHGRLPQPGEE